MDLFIIFWTENRATIEGIGGVLVVLIGMYIQDQKPELLPMFNKTKEQIKVAAKKVDELVVLIDAIKMPNQDIKKDAEKQGLHSAIEEIKNLPDQSAT